MASSSRGETFSEKINPTGDPIGGGPGYRDIKSSEKSDLVADSKEELLDAIKKASAGQIVYVQDEAEIDLTGVFDVEIPAGVTLASGRGRNESIGARLYSNSFSNDNNETGVFRTGGKKVRFTGLRLRGPSAEVADHHMELLGVANGIRALHENLEVDNCELWAWSKWSIDLAVAGGAYIHHNSIHHTRRWGYGYGVWVRGGGKALIEANLFDFSRHHIGSGAQATSSYEARYNICLYHDVQPSFDRHGDSDKAGESTLIHHNEFRNPDYAAILFRGNPLGEAQFHNNWFFHAKQETAFLITGAVTNKLDIHDNHYGGASAAFHPEAQAVVEPAFGPAPLTVSFDASGSRDREGGKIVCYHWNFPDTPDPIGPEAYTQKTSYVFKEPGRYHVMLSASNKFGVPGVIWIPVTVHPPQGGYVLSAWVKDSYVGPLKGYYRKQILMDGHVIWEEDVEGDEGGWQHLVLDVGPQVEGKKEVDLIFRLLAQKDITDPVKQIVEIFYYIDDVHLFGGEVLGGGFETGKNWEYHQQPEGDGGFTIYVSNFWTGEARSGKVGYVLGAGYSVKVKAGAMCETRQKILIGPKPGKP